MSKEPELQSVTNIGASRAKELRQKGYTVSDLASMKPAQVMNVVDNIKINMAEKIRDAAIERLYEVWEDPQKDNGVFYDAGFTEAVCGCGDKFTDEQMWRVHGMECDLTDKQTIEVVLPRELEVTQEGIEHIALKYYANGENLVSELDFESVDFDMHETDSAEDLMALIDDAGPTREPMISDA